MSAWSEWKAGFISDSEYRHIMYEEEMRDRDYLLGRDKDDEDCEDYDDEDDE